ncbi:hypothetical protein VPNG_08837 [Cytospora leucostoma]|uniref:RING-type domain-containing protein n=1 Tax=Cytospora leucostoma TaxID=1230097 RepID=A0A423VRT9_9PEZI|nr:hypothetical protein VPNG_08837 [Cytospora leucostoma]
MDDETARLVLQLQLEELQEATSKLKGKQPAGEVNDFEVSLKCYKDNLDESMTLVSDRILCKSIASAVQTDGEVIREVKVQEQQATADRALALRSRNGNIPVPTNTGRQLRETNDEGDDIDDELLQKMAAMNALGPADNNSKEVTGTNNVRCVTCLEYVASCDVAKAPCNHNYCRQCLQELFKLSLTDESLFPPRCCGQPITAEANRMFLSPQVVGEYQAKKLERDTPNRTYCHQPQCSAFIPPHFIRDEVARCTQPPLAAKKIEEDAKVTMQGLRNVTLERVAVKESMEAHEWPKAGVMIMPCTEAMYLGPGQVSMWPIIDLKDDVQRGKRRFRTKYEYERVLEDTTIEVLKREYGIDAFAIPGSTGVWVESKIPPPEMEGEQFQRGDGPRAGNRRENVRRIATIHTSITNDITQWGVSIHVGQPDPIVDSWTSFTNPWTPTRQHKTTTSIAAELAHIGNSPRHESRKGQLELYGQRKTRYLQTYFNTESPFAGSLYKSMPFSLIKTQGGRREPAPLGLDNRDLSTAWTYEFARQLGMHDGFVDHYGVVDFSEASSTDLPSKTPKPGFMTRPLLDEHWLTKPYEQVDVPSVQLGKSELVSSEIMEDTLRLEKTEGKLDSGGHGGWMISWPLWYETLKMKLEQSIAGGPWDTRLRSHEWEKEQAARQMRRKTALKKTEELKQQWAAEPRQLIRRPLTDQMIKELTERARDMEQALQEIPVGGRLFQELLESTAQMRQLLESRFTGWVKDTNDPKKPRKADLSAVLEESKAEARQAHYVQHDAQSSAAPLSSTSPTSTPAQEGAPTRNLGQSHQDIAWRRLPNTVVDRPVKDGRNDITPVDKPIISSERRRRGFVKFTETRPEQFHRGRRERGLANAAARRKAVPDAVSTRLKQPGGEPNYLPRTQQILSSDPD